jgi:5-methylcytosine-specific restriction endonuclease McrA
MIKRDQRFREYLMKIQKGRCNACGQRFKQRENWEPQFDHIIPIRAGGFSGEINIQLLHRGCNRNKSCKTYPGMQHTLFDYHEGSWLQRTNADPYLVFTGQAIEEKLRRAERNAKP